jgi:hypothetical protein
MNAEVKTRKQYVDSFATTSDAIEHENTCLSIGREFLPACARAVLEDRDDEREPTPEYWQWLADQRAVDGAAEA